MLSLKSARLMPLVVRTGRTFSNSRVTRYGSTMAPVVQRSCLVSETNFLAATGARRKHFPRLERNIPDFALTSRRFYASPQSSQSSPSSASSTPPQPRAPSPPNMPDREQIEKYFFRTLAFIWDTSYWLFLWARVNLNKFVLQNSTVKMYWQQFLNKMEKARKD